MVKKMLAFEFEGPATPCRETKETTVAELARIRERTFLLHGMKDVATKEKNWANRIERLASRLIER